jgi:hypothetical protein
VPGSANVKLQDMNMFVLFSGIGGVLLFSLATVAVLKHKYRPMAIATLVLCLPLSVLLAANNNHANALQNFLMGIAMFGVPFLLHAWLVAFLIRTQERRNAI